MSKRVNDAALEIIKHFEQGPGGGFAPRVYICPAGEPTIGWGHVVLPGERYGRITEAEAEALLRRDLGKFEKGVRDLTVGAKLNENQFSALVCFAYNVGLGAFKKSTLRRKVLAGDTAGAAAEFMRWVYGGGRKLRGLVRRRKAERKLFEAPVEKTFRVPKGLSLRRVAGLPPRPIPQRVQQLALGGARAPRRVRGSRGPRGR